MKYKRVFKRTSPEYDRAMVRIVAEHEARYHRALTKRFWRKFVESAFWGKKL